jgi:hypothetical protein
MNNSIEKTVAQIISIGFHPLLLPTFSAMLICFAVPHYFAHLSPSQERLSVIVIFIFTFLFPMFAIFLMKRLELISSFEMQDGKERIFPIIAIGSFYIWMYFYFKPSYRFPMANPLFANMLMGAILAIFFSFIINLFKKISLHAIGMGSLVAVLFSLLGISVYDLRFLLIILIVLAGIVGTARLILKAHEQDEIWIGYLVGFLSQYASFIVIPSVINLLK